MVSHIHSIKNGEPCRKAAGEGPDERWHEKNDCRALAESVQLYNRMPSLVIDTSAVLAVLLDEPTRPVLITATEGCSLVGAPSLSSEVGNALVAGFRRRRLAVETVLGAWANYQKVRVRLADIDVRNALEIAMELGLYAYDAYVLETARAERLPMLTLDAGLARAATRLGLKMVEVEK